MPADSDRVDGKSTKAPFNGKRKVPFDGHGVILAAVQRMWVKNTKFRKPDDRVFANKASNALDRHSLLHRHVKKTAQKPGVPGGIDFRRMRASLMRCYRARLEVARDDMAHAGSTGSITHFGCCDSLWQTSALPSPERYQRRDATSLIQKYTERSVVPVN